MNYTYPDYYHRFSCIASDCPATCCAGWKIVIDPASLKKYRQTKGPLGNRLANSIDRQDSTFYQYDKRCAFLNETDLCDLYSEGGPDMLCRTCRRYPRHIEEFENEREFSLSLSCPVVAGLLVSRQKPVTFRTVSRPGVQEEFPEFDECLYSVLCDTRDRFIQILQDRTHPTVFRMAMVLALAHDIQNRINHQQLFEIETFLQKTAQPSIYRQLAQKLNIRSDASQLAAHMQELMMLPDHFETLSNSWPGFLNTARAALYSGGSETYLAIRKQLLSHSGSPDAYQAQELQNEQMMVYFLFTYLTGAVYDGDAFSKVKAAVVSTLLLEELNLACSVSRSGPIPASVRAEHAWRFSREYEHSDINLGIMEQLMSSSSSASFQRLLDCLASMETDPFHI